MSVRPHFRMIAHSAFIIVSRKLVANAMPAPEPLTAPELEEAGEEADDPLD